MTSARSIRVRGVVQGVGFRPFVFQLARAQSLAGWVLNAEQGVDIHLEGHDAALEMFLRALATQAPPAASIAAIEIKTVDPVGFADFQILESRRQDRPTVRISSDLRVCDACVAELFDRADPRYAYPYINCTNCGPRYSVLLGLPYDRCNTTMNKWPLDAHCAAQFDDPDDRRFQAQPVACPGCGPHYFLRTSEAVVQGDEASIRGAAELIRAGKIVAVKGLGGYHLACDALNVEAVLALRERKFRKEKPFALMVKTLGIARQLVKIAPAAEALLTSLARPIVLAPAKQHLGGVAPESDELGLMLPYTPLHHLLFAAGAPSILVMTSANRSSEPIAYEDTDAVERLSGVADGFLVGERRIARRVDDSVVSAGAFGPVILRRSRGYAPAAVAVLPTERPILAVGADLKNTITLVVEGQAFVSQHIGDLEHYQSFQAFKETISDLLSMYKVSWDRLLVVHDAHPQYASTAHALGLPAVEKLSVQHHRAHLASVLAERSAWERQVLGVSFDGTGYGDDGTIWGGEIFAGSLAEGFERVAHLRPAALPGGDAAAQYPVQGAAGFLSQLERLPDLHAAPFNFPKRYQESLGLMRKNLRTFTTTSAGRLFDAAAALLGFTREVTFEGQGAMWLEHLARSSSLVKPYPFPLEGQELDFRPLLEAVASDRMLGRRTGEIARAFQRGIAGGLCEAVKQFCRSHNLGTVVLSGGVFQNQMLLEDLKGLLGNEPLEVWTNSAVPPNDGGISLGQAATAAFARIDPHCRPSAEHAFGSAEQAG